MNRYRKKAKLLSALIFCLMCVTTALIHEVQAQKQDSTQTLKIDTTLVSVPVVVSDRQGRYISGLKAPDFTLYEDRSKQPISFFADTEEAINVALLLDTSKSTAGVLDDIKKAAKEFIKQLRPQDRALIASFDYETVALCELTSDHKILERAVGKARIGEGGGTKLRDAVTAVMKEEFRTLKGRKAIVLLTDGKDRGSQVGEQELLDNAAEADTLVYSVFYNSSFGWPGRGRWGRMGGRGGRGWPGRYWQGQRRSGRGGDRNQEAIDFLQRLSEVSAGRYFNSEVSDLHKAFGQIVEELRHQYRLGFYPPDHPAGSIHSINVEVGAAGKAGSQNDIVVRSRRSYRVASESQGQ